MAAEPAGGPPQVTVPPCIAVSWGELVDRLTILEIKRERLRAPAALANVEQQLTALRAALAAGAQPAGLTPLRASLGAVNRRLWDVEDAIRQHEAARDFGAGFVALAREVYRKNDERGRLKRQVDLLLGSPLVEEKQYPAY